ncbi:sad1 unc family c-terminal [Cystoisospora suis]|uniref:Sad1 unc family c-terminal n=1 Tax=Cystoisospora suis TaxID=483139 RepID=A0A2C6KSU8_9APIC|nr:sad1 unc family c-terminal [Cystoisospora suis]
MSPSGFKRAEHLAYSPVHQQHTLVEGQKPISSGPSPSSSTYMVEGHRRLTRPVLLQQRGDPEAHDHEYGTAGGVLQFGYAQDDHVVEEEIQHEWHSRGSVREALEERRGDEEEEYVVDEQDEQEDEASLSGEPDEESDELPDEEESSVDASPLRQDLSRLRSHGRTSTGSFRLERQPLANDAEGEGDQRLAPPPPPRRVSLWGSILMHARRSLPFLGCEGLEGSLPPTPKPAAYEREDIQQLGASLLSTLAPPAWRGMKHRGMPTPAGPAWHDGRSGRKGESSHYPCDAQCLPGTPDLSSFTSVSPFSSLSGLWKRRKNQGTPGLSPEPNRGLKIKAQRVAFDTEDLTSVLIGVLRRRGPSFLLFFGFLTCAIYTIYRNLGSTMEDTLSTTAATGSGRNFTSFNAGSSGAWRMWHEEIQKLREELQEEREALREYRERIQLQLKKQVNSLSKQIQDELQTQQKHELQQALQRLQEEVGVIEKSGGDESERSVSQPSSRNRVFDTVDTLQEEVRGIGRRNEALEVAVDSLQMRIEKLAKQQEDVGSKQGILTPEFERKVKELHTQLVVDEERLVDWALESLGGRIVTAETAPPLIKPPSWSSSVSAAMWSLVRGEEAEEASGLAGFWAHKKPSVVLQPGRHAGNCYAFKGERGDITIQLPTAVFVTSVAIDDVASELFTPSAPRRFRLWGYEDPRAVSRWRSPSIEATQAQGKMSFNRKPKGGSSETSNDESVLGIFGRLSKLIWPFSEFSGGRGRSTSSAAVTSTQDKRVFLGEYEVVERKKLSFFELKERKHSLPLRKIVFEFLNNFGHSYTCVYRLRVHGDKAFPSGRHQP